MHDTKKRKGKIQEENLRVISAAARLLLNEMRCTSFKTELYPTNEEILSGTDFFATYALILYEIIGWL